MTQKIIITGVESIGRMSAALKAVAVEVCSKKSTHTDKESLCADLARLLSELFEVCWVCEKSRPSGRLLRYVYEIDMSADHLTWKRMRIVESARGGPLDPLSGQSGRIRAFWRGVPRLLSLRYPRAPPPRLRGIRPAAVYTA